MLRALRPRRPIERSAVERGADLGPNPWASYSISNHFGVGRDPMALPAFFRGLAHRVAIISTLPLRAEVDGQPAGVPVELLEQPDPAEDLQTTLARMEASNVLRGEIVAVLSAFDEDGYARALKVVDPAKATRESDGSWTIGNKSFPPSQVLHHPWLVLPGETRGISIVEQFRRTFVGELAAVDFQANFYLDGGQPTTVIRNSDTEASDAEMEAVLQRYLAKVAGGRREPIVLPDTLTIETHALSNSDSQFLESRQFALVDIANIVGVPPYFVGAPGSTSIYSNLTQERQNLLDIYLRNSIYAIERAFTSLLPEGVKAKFDANSFLRMDPKATVDTLAVEMQWMAVNEIRAVQGLPPLPGGDALPSVQAPSATPQQEAQRDVAV